MTEDDAQAALDQLLATIATHEDVRALRQDMVLLMGRVRRDTHALMDAIALMKYIDSEARQHGTTPED
jgi:hypothetical protein